MEELSLFTYKEAVELILGFYTYTSGFWEDELEKVQKAIFNDKLDNLLKNMFQKKKESRKYARDFIEKHVESVIKDRERITEKEILEAVEISKNVFVV